MVLEISEIKRLRRLTTARLRSRPIAGGNTLHHSSEFSRISGGWAPMGIRSSLSARVIAMNDRRSTARTRIDKGALLFFSGQIGVRSCCVTDITNVGAGIRTEDLPVLPPNFELSFDNFRTVRKCRMIWRDGDSLGVAFEN